MGEVDVSLVEHHDFAIGDALSPITSKCTTCDHFKVHHPGRVIF
jgi:hypothetical protein